MTASLSLFVIMYVLVILLIAANTHHTPSKGGRILDEFELATDAYMPYTVSWWYNAVIFVWMTYVSYDVYKSELTGVAWYSFTLWSWTIITIRHGLCALGPFVPQVRLLAEIMRFPVLLSASITFAVWNFVLMPAITLVFIKEREKRFNFLKFATGFRLTQLHVFNILFAVLNGAYAEPRRPLHLGDLDAVFGYMTIYMTFYYGIMDRLSL